MLLATPSPVASGPCTALAADYVRYSQNLADRMADGIGDNSAPRALDRDMEDSNDLAQAQMTLDLMRDHHCTMPDRAPGAGPWIGAALTCQKDRLSSPGAAQPASCDRASWKPSGGE